MVMSRAARKVEHCVIYLYTALQCKEGEVVSVFRLYSYNRWPLLS